MTNFDDFEDVSFAENQDPRCPVVLVLDCSSSMIESRPGQQMSPMQALDAGLDVLVSELHKDPLAKRRVEVSVVAFGSNVNPATEFATVENLVLPGLEPMGVTSMGAAVNEAMDAIENRKHMYKANGIKYYRPWVLLISDGLPTDNIDSAVSRVRAAEEKKSIAFFAVGVDGADTDILGKFSNRGALSLQGMRFNELFQWLSASQASVSASQPGDAVPLPSPAGWAEV